MPFLQAVKFDPDHLLLSSELAAEFYAAVADAPVVDYHGHLDAGELLANRPYADLHDLWVGRDPYKHRCMRLAGVPEAEITGPEVGPAQKFQRWAQTFPGLLGGPVFLWSRLELARYFGVLDPLNADTAQAIWNRCGEMLGGGDFLPRSLLERAGVEAVCTSDPLLADLAAHAKLAASGWRVKVLPSVRPDDALAFGEPGHAGWMLRLGERAGRAVETWAQFTEALAVCLDAFGELGCLLADHALDGWSYSPVARPEAAFASYVKGDASQSSALADATLAWLAGEYARRGWTMQMHINAERRASSRLRQLVGPAGGYATMGDAAGTRDLVRLFDDLERADSLPRVILYSLNPTVNEALATLTGSFARDGTAAWLQLGPPWWYNDHPSGIRRHLDTLASYSLLGTSVGMTTDARSPLSMVRHECFRRILCSWVAERIRTGDWPDDRASAAALIRRVAHSNARKMIAGGKEP